MRLNIKKLAVLAATPLVAIAMVSCASSSANSTASIDCHKSDTARSAVLKQAQEAVDAAQKAVDKAKDGTPAEKKADKQKSDAQAEQKQLQKEAAACTTPSPSASPSPSNAKVPADWKTIYYSKLPGVPTGYFGPKSACIQTKSADDCRQDLETTWKHDPDILSVWLVHFNLLPGQQDLVAKLTAAHQPQSVIDQQVEALRQKFAKTLADYKQRQVWQPKAAAVLDSIPDLTIQPLSGVYYTTYIDTSGAVHQTTKNMNPTINVAIKGTLANGQAFEDKLDCFHQPVSKKPIPNVPTGPSPTPTPTPTPSKTPYCTEVYIPVPKNGLCPKNPAKGPDENPSIPQQVRQTSPAPDNASEVAQPPAKPTDSGNGIPPSSSPRVTPSPAPTHISGPTASSTPTQPPTTPSPIQASPTATDPGGIGTHGP